ncbi:hypothetical protein Taro_023321, partial [Colocasia esculenta]|nr:hypothetical protein [Colocasia esculenta]
MLHGKQTRKTPSTAAGRVRRGRKDPHHPPRNLHASKGFELPHLALHQAAAAAFTINYLHLLYVIPLGHTKDLVALRNLGFEFPFNKNNDYPRGSLATRIGRYAWHVRTTDPCIKLRSRLTSVTILSL